MGGIEEIIFRRRSIRKFKPDVPPSEWIDGMVLCGSRAPSPSHSQPVRFVRVMSSGAKDRLREAMAKGRQALLDKIAQAGGSKKARNYVNSYFRFSEFMFEAPVLMCVGTDPQAGRDLSDYPEIEDKGRRRRDLDISVGLAVKGYLLKGEELGLASCILTAPLMYADNPEEALGTGGVDIRCFIVSGWPAEEPPPLERKTLSEVFRVV